MSHVDWDVLTNNMGMTSFWMRFSGFSYLVYGCGKNHHMLVNAALRIILMTEETPGAEI